MSQFLRALTHVKRLAVSDATLKSLSFAEDLLGNLPTFHNTKQLIMTSGETADKALIALLKAIPNLESLVFDMDPPCSDDEEEDYVAGNNADGELNLDNKDDDWKLDLRSMTTEECSDGNKPSSNKCAQCKGYLIMLCPLCNFIEVWSCII
ncbi:uncharacterized protein LOC113309242 isoform X2 [Papaver somniferum]|uniref:uncharacterized protein LOC113309242 isoform X2 n=1 Tax=Papaver somniferum TaxID=3469 RepID=UPI000E70421C|nr:uncharacterized protein LOC113309242 isoform X2 [Papaver somniferum]